MNERLQRLTERGVSIWLDQIRRTMTTGGELQHLIDEYSLRGETSNPSIFEKAILGSDDYDDELRALARDGLDAQAIFRRVSVHDVQLACDVLRPVFDELDGADGYVSIEVSPALARDGDATLAEARALWAEVDRPNVMVKIPGTPEAVSAIEEATYDGINVNITLLFSVERYADVAEAYIKGMERRLDEGKSLEMASVASFFVSRVDTLVDRQLQERGAPAGLEGTAGLANARAAYLRFEEIFRGDRFARLREAGARVQRPLWASTGVKNPSYPDTLYVDGLVAPDTVNTMPMATLLAAAERADAPEDTARQDPSEDLKALADAGIDLDAVTEQLLGDGITLFEGAFSSLIDGVESQREALITGRPPTIESSIPDDLEPALADRIKQAAADGVARRVWAKDPTLWGGDTDTPELSNRLGWLTISEPMLEHLSELEEFVAAARADGLTHTVLLGMGGSSLGPEVLRRSFGLADLHVLDSTDPDAILGVEAAIEFDKTLFVVSSKSGGTVETLSHFAYFYDRAGQDGSHFVAVTDPGSPLDDLAGEKGFRGVFRNDPDIGGRYSVLSYFGLVPAALAGAPVRELLHRAQVAEENCSAFDASAANSGLWLGVALGELANQGRDKLTLVVDSPTDSFGLWAEQLVAESTGKQGRGIVPVPAEPLGDPEAYGPDRVLVHLRHENGHDDRLQDLARSGQPLLTLHTHGATDLGRLFFFAEFAVAVAGWALGINPFNQPNVQEAKDATNTALESGDVEAAAGSVDDLLALLDGVEPPGYVSLHGYLAPSDEFDAAADELRAAIRDRTRAAVTFGYGPRFLHSTGQLHKGGPATGHFVQLLHDGERDVEIPGRDLTFRTLKHAQATGDLRTLEAHDRPVVRLELDGDPVAAVRDLAQRVRGSG